MAGKARARVLFRLEGEVRGQLRIWQQKNDGSHYVQTMLEDAALHRLGQHVGDTRQVAEFELIEKRSGPKVSVHASGQVHVKVDGSREKPISFHVPELTSLTHLIPIAEVAPAIRTKYPMIELPRKTDTILDLPFAADSRIGFVLFIGPPVAEAREVCHVDVPIIPLSGPSTGRFLYFEHNSLAFGIFAFQLASWADERPDDLEHWRFDIRPNAEDYRASAVIHGDEVAIGGQRIRLSDHRLELNGARQEVSFKPPSSEGP